jgi:hypothetical protein
LVDLEYVCPWYYWESSNFTLIFFYWLWMRGGRED